MSPVAASYSPGSSPDISYRSLRPNTGQAAANTAKVYQQEETGLRVANFEAMRSSEFRDWFESSAKAGLVRQEDVPKVEVAVGGTLYGKENETPRNYIKELRSGLAEAMSNNDSSAEAAIRRLWQILELQQGRLYGIDTTA